jgi:hypothetical protein
MPCHIMSALHGSKVLHGTGFPHEKWDMHVALSPALDAVAKDVVRPQPRNSPHQHSRLTEISTLITAIFVKLDGSLGAGRSDM